MEGLCLPCPAISLRFMFISSVPKTMPGIQEILLDKGVVGTASYNKLGEDESEGMQSVCVRRLLRGSRDAAQQRGGI